MSGPGEEVVRVWREGLTSPKSAMAAVTLACVVLTPAAARAANDAAPFSVDVWEPPFKITVARSALGNPGGEIHGKVVDTSAGPFGLARIRFASATPEIRAWMSAWGST